MIGKSLQRAVIVAMPETHENDYPCSNRRPMSALHDASIVDEHASLYLSRKYKNISVVSGPGGG